MSLMTPTSERLAQPMSASNEAEDPAPSPHFALNLWKVPQGSLPSSHRNLSSPDSDY